MQPFFFGLYHVLEPGRMRHNQCRLWLSGLYAPVLLLGQIGNGTAGGT